MANAFALFIEGVVAVLLVTTICYCVVLNRKLVRLRSDETALRATIAELVTATDIAERAIAGLKVAIRDCDSTLGERLRRAEAMSETMAGQLSQGEDVLKRITMITEAARPAVVATMPEPETAAKPAPSRAASAAAAAQALAMRLRERNAGVAA